MAIDDGRVRDIFDEGNLEELEAWVLRHHRRSIFQIVEDRSINGMAFRIVSGAVHLSPAALEVFGPHLGIPRQREPGRN